MRCHQCNEYIPENLGIKNCIKCDAELKDEVNTNNENPCVLQTEQIVEIKYEDLTKEQEALLKERLERGVKSLLHGSLVWMFLIIATIIPLKYIPTRKAQAVQGIEANQSFAEYFGIFPTLIFLLIWGIFIYSLVLHYSKFFKLQKDLRERKIITVVSKIANIQELKGDEEKEYNVFLEKNKANINKIRLLISELPNICKGDTVKVTLTKNAHSVLSTEIVDGSF